MATTTQQMPSSPGNNKRKRGASDQDVGRDNKFPDTIDDGSQNENIYHSLLQGITDSNMHNAGLSSQEESSRTAQAALNQQSSYPEPMFDPSGVPAPFDDQANPSPQQPIPQSIGSGSQTIFDARSTPNKPAVGSSAWHDQRKNNHKEVERRRREVINEGIENIAKMIPGNEKNKGAILQRTCQYIQQMQDAITKFESERKVFEITQNELTDRNDRLRDSAQRAWGETAKWQQRCKDAGLEFDDYDVGPGDELAEDQAGNPATSAS